MKATGILAEYDRSGLSSLYGRPLPKGQEPPERGTYAGYVSLGTGWLMPEMKTRMNAKWLHKKNEMQLFTTTTDQLKSVQ